MEFKSIKIFDIAQKDGVVLGMCTLELPVEDIVDPLYLDAEFQNLYPPNSIFAETYELWLKHQSCFWSVHENDPSIDRDKFIALAPKEFQKILLTTVGCIAIGDGIVLDKISGCMMPNITSIELRAMMSDQESREFIHKKMYNHMLDVSPNADYYRSVEFRNKFMTPLQDLADEYQTDDIRIQMFFIMMCEYILFAPMFQTICYTATKGYAPKLCDLNLLVMRDEFIHYLNARLQSSKFKKKIDIDLARDILGKFSDLTLKLFSSIVGDYDDGVYNMEHVTLHFKHVLHGFMYENGLYKTNEEFQEFNKKYGTTPAEFYMNLPKCELKINRMESNSTIYAVPGDTSELIKPSKRKRV